MCLADGGEGIARPVEPSGVADVVFAHLARVASPLDSALFQMRGDGPTVNAEVGGEIGERTAGPVAGHEFVHVGISQPALDGPSVRV